jgi:hypothetical protein
MSRGLVMANLTAPLLKTSPERGFRKLSNSGQRPFQALNSVGVVREQSYNTKENS